jgi:hypothetical protein
VKQINRSRERSLSVLSVLFCLSLQQPAEKQTAETGDPVDGDW